MKIVVLLCLAVAGAVAVAGSEPVVKECKGNPCKNGATCKKKLNDYHCKCKNGWFGKNCDKECCRNNDCSDYRGLKTVTKSGKTCKYWNHVQKYRPRPSIQPEGSSTFWDKYIRHYLLQLPKPSKQRPDGARLDKYHFVLNKNFCRNPGGEEPFAWCWTTDGSWDECDIPRCPETVGCGKGTRCKHYRGTKATTVSGRTCQAWNIQSPHNHVNTPDRKPWAGLEKNYCRNPSPKYHSYAWCYTTDPKKRWEKCDIPLCADKDYCKPNPCKNGATCEENPSDYNCKCKAGWTGKNCEKGILV